jgi:hypothetical protein
MVLITPFETLRMRWLFLSRWRRFTGIYCDSVRVTNWALIARLPRR